MPQRTFFEAVTSFDDSTSFIDSVAHPKSIGLTSVVSVVLGSIATFTETYVGIAPAVAICIIVLFLIELITGIKASKREGVKFESHKFGRGFIKLAIYFVMIGVMHQLSIHMAPGEGSLLDFNIYAWLGYIFLNFTIIQLTISCIENFNRLGWDEFIPVLSRLSDFLNLRKPKKDLDNGEPN